MPFGIMTCIVASGHILHEVEQFACNGVNDLALLYP